MLNKFAVTKQNMFHWSTDLPIPELGTWTWPVQCENSVSVRWRMTTVIGWHLRDDRDIAALNN